MSDKESFDLATTLETLLPLLDFEDLRESVIELIRKLEPYASEQHLASLPSYSFDNVQAVASAFPSRPTYKQTPRYRLYLVINKYLQPINLIREFIRMVGILEDSLPEVEINVPKSNAFAETYDEVLKSFEHTDVYQTLQRAILPYVLVTDMELRDFKPDEHRYEFLLFPKAISDPIYYVERLEKIESMLDSDSDFFHLLEEETRIHRRKEKLNKFWDAMDFKPGFFWLRFDIKNLLLKSREPGLAGVPKG